MHVPDGVLPGSVCLAGFAATALCCGATLNIIGRREDPHEAIPRASMLTAAFFVASWIHIPVPPASVHLVLNGLLGAVLGPFAFSSILIGLLFQAVMFQHGGLTTLGVNAILMGVPALLVGALVRSMHRAWRRSRAWAAVLGFVAGAGGVGLAAVGLSVLLVLAVPAEVDPTVRQAGIVVLTAAHVPVMLVEGGLTALVMVFLRQVRPELLER
jgi:cobalt/nickel transport system permease protein